MTGTRVMVLGSLVRLLYGLVAMFAPRFAAGRLAAAEPDSVMNLRGFGGQHIAVAIFTLAASRNPQIGRPALLLNGGIEICDALAGALEVRERRVREPVAAGGVALPLVGLATWVAAYRRLPG